MEKGKFSNSITLPFLFLVSFILGCNEAPTSSTAFLTISIPEVPQQKQSGSRKVGHRAKLPASIDDLQFTLYAEEKVIDTYRVGQDDKDAHTFIVPIGIQLKISGDASKDDKITHYGESIIKPLGPNQHVSVTLILNPVDDKSAAIILSFKGAAPDEADVAIDTSIQITLLDSIDQTTINNDTFLLKDSKGDTVSSTISATSEGIELAPGESLLPEEEYTVILSDKIKYNDGTFITSVTWKFSTQSTRDKPDPTTPVLPVSSASHANGIFSVTQSVTLSCDANNASPCDSIFYTLDGSTPDTNSEIYSTPLQISTDTTLVFFATNENADASETKIVEFGFDTIPPEVSASIPGDTYYESKSVSLGCSDIGSGCSDIFFTLDGSQPTSNSQKYSSPIAITQTLTMKFFSKDIAGNSSIINMLSFIIDNSTPDVVVFPSGGTYNSNQTVALNCVQSDPQKCANIYYTLNGDTPDTQSTQYSTPVAISNNTTLKYYVADIANNSSVIKTEDYLIDKVLPIVQASVSSGLYGSAQTINLVCTDGNSGCQSIHYTVDGFTPTNASTRFSNSLLIDSNTTVKFIAFDKATNRSDINIETYTIDTRLPIVSSTLQGGKFGVNQITELVCDDGAGSGCEKIYYTLDGSTPTANSAIYSAPIMIDSSLTLSYFAEDLVKNKSAIQTQTFTINKTLPMVFSSITDGLINATETIDLYCANTSNLCSDIFYTLDDTALPNTFIKYQSPFTLNQSGNLRYYAINIAGTSTIKTTAVVLDNIAPTVISLFPINADLKSGVKNRLSATFTEAIDPATVTPQSLVVTSGGISVSGQVSVQDQTIYFDADDYLNHGITYTAVLSNNIKDIAGNSLVSSPAWSFKTLAAPIRISHDSYATIHQPLSLSATNSNGNILKLWMEYGSAATGADAKYSYYTPENDSWTKPKKMTGFSIHFLSALVGNDSNFLFVNNRGIGVIFDGTTWGTSVQIGFNTIITGKVQIKSVNNRFAAAVLVRKDGLIKPYVRVYNGTVWEDRVELSGGAIDNAQNLSLATDENGFGVQWTVSSATPELYNRFYNGITWGTRITTATGVVYYPTFTGSNGFYGMSWVDGSRRALKARTYDGTLSAPVQLNSGLRVIPNNPEVVRGDNGYLITWEEGTEIHGSVFDNTAKSFGTSSVIASNAYIYKRKIEEEVASNGTGYAVIYPKVDVNNNQLIRLYANVYDGQSWGGEATIDNGLTSINTEYSRTNYPRSVFFRVPYQIKSDTVGYAAVWLQNDGVADRIFESRYNSGDWSTVNLLDTPNGDARKPFIDASPGYFYYSWQQTDGISNVLYGRRYSAGNLQPQKLIAIPAPGIAKLPVIRKNNNGITVAVWQQVSTIWKVFLSSNSGSGWTKPLAIPFCYENHQLETNGTTFLITCRDLNGYFHAAIFDGTSLEATTQISTNYDLNSSPVIATDGNDYAVSWSSSTTGNPITARIYDSKNSIWLTEEKLFDSARNSRPQIGFGGGQFALIWEDVGAINTEYNVFTSRHNGTSWSTPEQMNTNPVTGRIYFISSNIISYQNKLMVRWVDAGDVLQRVYNPVNQNWDSEQNVNGIYRADDRINSSVNNNSILTIWKNTTDGMYASINNGVTMTAPLNIATSTLNVTGLYVAGSYQGLHAAAWVDNSGYVLKVNKYNGSKWLSNEKMIGKTKNNVRVTLGDIVHTGNGFRSIYVTGDDNDAGKINTARIWLSSEF